jgi:hypothetical protein
VCINIRMVKLRDGCCMSEIFLCCCCCCWRLVPFKVFWYIFLCRAIDDRKIIIRMIKKYRNFQLILVTIVVAAMMISRGISPTLPSHIIVIVQHHYAQALNNTEWMLMNFQLKNALALLCHLLQIPSSYFIHYLAS